MSDLAERIAEVLCDNEDHDHGDPFRWARLETLAERIVETLGLKTEYAVTSGGFREFTPYETPEEAERGLAVHLINNEQCTRCGDEIPLWARDPQIVTRYVTKWENPDD